MKGHGKLFDGEGNFVAEGEVEIVQTSDAFKAFTDATLGEPFEYPDDAEVLLCAGGTPGNAADQFDRLTAQGFRVDLVRGCYSKPER